MAKWKKFHSTLTRISNLILTETIVQVVFFISFPASLPTAHLASLLMFPHYAFFFWTFDFSLISSFSLASRAREGQCWLLLTRLSRTWRCDHSQLSLTDVTTNASVENVMNRLEMVRDFRSWTCEVLMGKTRRKLQKFHVESARNTWEVSWLQIDFFIRFAALTWTCDNFDSKSSFINVFVMNWNNFFTNFCSVVCRRFSQKHFKTCLYKNDRDFPQTFRVNLRHSTCDFSRSISSHFLPFHHRRNWIRPSQRRRQIIAFGKKLREFPRNSFHESSTRKTAIPRCRTAGKLDCGIRRNKPASKLHPELHVCSKAFGSRGRGSH